MAQSMGKICVTMTTMKLDVEKFTGKNDFRLCKIKMQVLLI